MKIAFFTDAYFPYVCGVSVSVYEYAQHLVENGHEVIIFAPAPKDKKLVSFDKRIKMVWLPSVDSFYADLRIGAPSPRSFLKLKKFSPDVIHVHTNLFVGGEGVVAARLLRTPWVYSFHTYFMDSSSFKVMGIRRSLSLVEKSLWKYARHFSKSSQAILCPTDFVKNDLKKHGFEGRIEVLPTGISFAKIKSSLSKKMQIRKKFDLRDKVILGVGRLSNEKNWELLLAAQQLLYQDGNRYTLAIIGQGPAEEELRFLARVLGIEHRVRFLGQIPHEELIQEGCYLLGDVFAMPSSWETQGMVTLEAMAFGLPIVALKSKGTQDLVGEAGVLVDGEEKEFARAIQMVLGDERLASDLGKASLARAQEFDMKLLAKKLENIYTSVLK
jgi:glycosyltransferase involved in cell wall biosynthesis